MYDHGNYDYMHGCLMPEGYHKWDLGNPGHPKHLTHLEYHVLVNLHNDLNKGRNYGKAKQIAYCELGRRGHGSWAHERKQNTSSTMRRHYKSTANKKTRQYLHNEMMEEYHDGLQD